MKMKHRVTDDCFVCDICDRHLQSAELLHRHKSWNFLKRPRLSKDSEKVPRGGSIPKKIQRKSIQELEETWLDDLVDKYCEIII